MYIDLNDYQFQLRPETTRVEVFESLEFRAEKIIDRYTNNRVRNMASVPEAVKLLMVELINIEFNLGAKAVDQPAVQSFSNDGYSETYAEPATVENIKKLEERLVMEYLSGEYDDEGVPLLYMGV